MLKVTLVSPLEKYTVTELSGLFLDTVTGQRGILSGHMDLVAQLKNRSLVRLVKNEVETHFRLGDAAFVKFAHNEAVILTQEFIKEKEDFCPV